MSDLDLVRRIVTGDAAAADRLVRDHGGRLLALFRRMRLTPDEDEDAVQTVFERLFRNDRRALREWRGDCSLAGYLSSIALNVGRTAFQARRESDDPDPEDLRDPAPSPARYLVLRRRRVYLEEALQRLAERDRTLLTLRELEGLSYAEIGAVTGMNVNNVGVALHRAQHRLRRALLELVPASGEASWSDDEPELFDA